MKTLITMLLFAASGLVFGADLDAAAQSKLIDFVASLKVPVPQKMITGNQPISDGGDQVGIEISKVFVAGHPAFNEGLRASLIGTAKRPLALVFWIQSEIAYYYVPFPDVTEIDRPRRLTKVGNRIYRIESNRATRNGVHVEKRLP